jgi:regulator of cell morphogenesis and NO signaling
MNDTGIIDVTLPVNAIIARYPATVAVFKAHGVDACCGGARPVAEAATRHGIDLADLVADLAKATA